IDHRHENQRKNHKGREPDALGHSARHNGGAGGGEHSLKEEVRPVGVTAALRVGGRQSVFGKGQTEASEAEVPVEFAGIHQIETTDVVRQKTDTDDVDILKENVHRVLGAGQS